jgi:hypothetical protein
MLGASKVGWNHLVASELQITKRVIRSLHQRQADSRIAPGFVQLLATQTELDTVISRWRGFFPRQIRRRRP